MTSFLKGSNIPAAPAYGVYIYQLKGYSYHDFLDRWLLLIRKPLNQWLLVCKMGHHVESFTILINCYKISLSYVITVCHWW